MITTLFDDFKEEGRAEGLVEGWSSALLIVLAAREIPLSDADRDRNTRAGDSRSGISRRSARYGQ